MSPTTSQMLSTIAPVGHSHIPWDTTTERGMRLLNPGSPTDRRRQPYCTFQTATITAGRLEEVALRNL
ncbi:hypothetical protein ACFCV3_00105 [Kribbella sp. NPDC056345]|uniref:hypothetical protein n=1 Tax=Kribbella sp. NPDC056345 TaxID=3345789 RepID=UPI0035E1A77F